ncbi:MAG: TetR/AcrR family transcriptional regulator [Hyphomicrobiales bacterium]|nr:MAG: TetR/AcrR family transcriptional regulator [Hyphomicrobiales bacterium]
MPTEQNAPDKVSRDAILEAAADAIARTSHNVTSIEAVIAAMRFSYEDVVDAFGSSSGLLTALVERLALSLLEPLVHRTPGHGIHERLNAFGQRVIEAHRSSQLQCLYRIALNNDVRKNGVAQDFYRQGPGLVTAGLTSFFDAAHAAGAVTPQASHALASHFMALMRSTLDMVDTTAFGGPSILRTLAAGKVSSVVERFCAGIQKKVDHAYVVR